MMESRSSSGDGGDDASNLLLDADDADEQVRALAQALAPQVEELEALLASPTKDLIIDKSMEAGDGGADGGPSMDLDGYDEDDDMDHELSQLAASEDLLRQELEFAQDYTSFLKSSHASSSIPEDSSDPTDDDKEEEKDNDDNDNDNDNDNKEEGDTHEGDDNDKEEEKDTVQDNQDSNKEDTPPEKDTDTKTAPPLQESQKPPLGPTQEALKRLKPKMPTTTTTTTTTSATTMAVDDDYDLTLPTTPSNITPRAPPPFSSSDPQEDPSQKGYYTLADHARHVKLSIEPKGGWYSYPLELDVSSIAASEQHDDPTTTTTTTTTGDDDNQDCFVREFALPLPASDLKRLYVGLTDTTAPKNNNHAHGGGGGGGGDEDATMDPHAVDPANRSLLDSEGTSALWESENDVFLPVRIIAIRIRPDVLCGAVMDAVNHALDNLGAEVVKRQGGHLRGVVGALVTGGLDDVDLQHPRTTTASGGAAAAAAAAGGSHNIAPVNHYFLQPPSGQLPPFIVDAQLCLYKGGSTLNEPSSSCCERHLVIRTYHAVLPNEDPHSDVMNSLPPPTPELQRIDPKPHLRLREVASLVQRIESDGAATKIMRTVGGSSSGSGGGGGTTPPPTTTTPGAVAPSPNPATTTPGGELATSPPPHDDSTAPPPRRGWSPLKMFTSNPSSARRFTDKGELAMAVTSQLLNQFRPCVSVTAGTLTIPALSDDDWPVVQASWRFITECWTELESRDLSYSTLATPATGFGAFPALPTLDVHFCSQMRRFSRESMIVSLLRSASELEQYARESEYSCASLIQTLKPMFELYEIEPPALPKPVPLTAYPLDFTPPQATCPPWGLSVMEALNVVAAKSGDANKATADAAAAASPDNPDAACAHAVAVASSFGREEEAVHLVLNAFHRQDDEEQAARLDRKNIQVMDRLAKMQAHKRASIFAIRESYRRSSNAALASDDFYEKSLTAGRDSALAEHDPGLLSLQHQVPLHKCSVLAGSATTGTCYTTTTHVLFWTQSIPLLGGHQGTLFDIRTVDFVIQKASKPRLSPITLPEGISVKHKETKKTLYKFRPSIGAERWKTFVDIVQQVAVENPDDLKFSERGGILYMYGDKPSGGTKDAPSTPVNEGAESV